MKIVGIDYGHGETSAGYVNSETVYGNEIPMSDLQVANGAIVIPSIICKMSTDEYVIDPLDYQIATCKEFGICFKAPLVGNEQYAKITEENYQFFRAFIQQVYKSITSNGNNPLHDDGRGNPDYKVYIACPSGWSDIQIQAYKSFVINECHVPVVDIVKESRAAYIASRRKVGEGIRNQGGNVLVIDFGSSTVDFTYFNNDCRFEPIHEGYPNGASQIENDVFDYMIGQCEEAHTNYLKLAERCGETRAKNLLLYTIRKTKEDYFSKDNIEYLNPSIHLEKALCDRSLRAFYIEPQEVYGYSKDFFENQILKEYKQSLFDMLIDFTNKEGVASIDKVILTGGASRMKFFKQMISDQYHVSKEENTLIVDLESSLTISEGIAAFGYMNEKSETNEKPLKEDVENFINEKLENILRSSINTAVSDCYCNEFTKITERYKNGYISDSYSRHNLDSLEDAFIEFMKSYVTSPETVGAKVMATVQKSVSDAINENLVNFAKSWSYDIDSINVDFSFDTSFFLPAETAKGILEFMWSKCFEYINERDFFGATEKTPYRDRDSDDRCSIVTNLNSNLRVKCNSLHYDEDLSEELSVIEIAIREKIQDVIDSAKLQMYK